MHLQQLSRLKAPLPLLLTFNGGFVDTAGFLALQGLFTAHVTGNFVTLGASLVFGTSGALAKLLALPVFSVVVILTRLLGHALHQRDLPVKRVLLAIMAVLLTVGGVLVIRLPPATSGDAALALAAGLVLVAAMAIQNGLHRIYLPQSPPGTLMTGTTTQIMIDIADLLLAVGQPIDPAVRDRLRRMALQVAIFAVGCGIAALLTAAVGHWCFVVPPLIALWSLASSD